MEKKWVVLVFGIVALCAGNFAFADYYPVTGKSFTGRTSVEYALSGGNIRGEHVNYAYVEKACPGKILDTAKTKIHLGVGRNITRVDVKVQINNYAQMTAVPVAIVEAYFEKFEGENDEIASEPVTCEVKVLSRE